MSQSLQDARYEAAAQSYEGYDFNAEITDHDGWCDTHTDHWTRICYGETEHERERLNFHVVFAPGTDHVIEQYALDMATGNLI